MGIPQAGGLGCDFGACAGPVPDSGFEATEVLGGAGTFVAPGVGTAIGIAVGVALDAYLAYKLYRIHQARRADLGQFNDAVRRVEKVCGRALTKDERRRLHDGLHSPALGPVGFQDIVREGVSMFCPHKYGELDGK